MALVNPSTPPKDAESATLNSRYSVPLYDPHGLGSPPSADIPTYPTWKDQNHGSPSSKHSPDATFTQEPIHQSRRGRRRRSSEFVQTSVEEASDGRNGYKVKNTVEDSHNSEPLLWWQRQKPDEHSETEQSSGNSKGRQSNLPPLQTHEQTETSSSPAPSLRSPAAQFLSSMNETLGSPSSFSEGARSERAYSLSSVRSNSQSQRASMAMLYSQLASEDSSLRIGSAAAQMYSAAQASGNQSASSSLQPDEEGSRIGPDGRYLLGRTIGFGGFSTIREAWDLGPGARNEGKEDKETMHRVAVKIVYSSNEDVVDGAAQENEELRIWETIPAHPNLLPLLHHERITIDEEKTDSKKSAISFLVMPYCEGSLLAYVKTEGILPDKAAPSSGDYSLSRSSSLHSNKAPVQQSDASLSRQPHPRTGSGFIPRTSGMRVASVPLSNVLGHSPSLASNTATVGATSSLLRRGSSRISRNQRQTNGIPFWAAREVMQQVTEALLCLHTRAGIVHGDLKLENVLGQRSTSRILRTRGDDESGRRELGDSDDEESLSSHRNVEVAIKETVCWRVADFGLASRVSIVPQVSKLKSVSTGSKQNRRFNSTSQQQGAEESSKKAKKGRKGIGSAGGSLAYTAPEMFLPSSSMITEGEETNSPFAPDMWALGCILYVLCSGKLPFSDSFEPRLQMKIAKGKWEMPSRLRRRNERTNMPAFVQDADRRRERERSTSGNVASESMSRTNSLSSSLMAFKPFHPVNTSVGSNMVMDMSASMPALQERRYFENGGVRSTSDQSIILHDSAEEPFEEEDEQEEDSLESDTDEQIDRDMDGSSRDRVSIRLALRKLLEPDPRKRWTIEQLASLPWISGTSSAPYSGMEAESKRLKVLKDGYLLSSMEESSLLGQSFNTNKRPSLAQMSISEHTSQEAVSRQDDENEDDEDGNDFGRGRSIRRPAGDERPAKPIDIDRSGSRSRSRPRPSRIDSSPWELETSFEKSMQPGSDWMGIPTRRQLQRSNSADTHSLPRDHSTSSRGRRSVSRPPRLEMVKAREIKRTKDGSPVPTTSTRGSNESASRSSTSRSRSRARDALHEIASREERKEATGEEKLWWQRGRMSGR